MLQITKLHKKASVNCLYSFNAFLAAVRKDLQENIIATAIAVAVFPAKYTSESDDFDLVVEKAKNWMATRLRLRLEKLENLKQDAITLF